MCSCDFLSSRRVCPCFLRVWSPFTPPHSAAPLALGLIVFFGFTSLLSFFVLRFLGSHRSFLFFFLSICVFFGSAFLFASVCFYHLFFSIFSFLVLPFLLFQVHLQPCVSLFAWFPFPFLGVFCFSAPSCDSAVFPQICLYVVSFFDVVDY